ncbi:hypothetical protein CF8_4191 [Nocardioides sp. CF8]|nr:hypothetical protein CF8_4191 [Nocardioides sp. CF8]
MGAAWARPGNSTYFASGSALAGAGDQSVCVEFEADYQAGIPQTGEIG